MTETSEQGFSQYFPTREDIEAVFSDEGWTTCEGCGEEYPEGAECDCGYVPDREPSDDFPMYLEYEGAYGLSGYDSFYDNEPSYDW